MALQQRAASDHAVELPEPWRSAAVTVVLPTYNEAANLPVMVAELLALPLPGLRILVADDNSPDGTGDIADQLAQKYGADRITVAHRPGKQGLGRAYVDGMTQAISAGASYVAQMDSDLSHSPHYLPQMLGTLLATRADLVAGSTVRRRRQPGPRMVLAAQGPVRVRQPLRPRPAAPRRPRRHRRVQTLVRHRPDRHRRRQRPQQRLQLPGRDELPRRPARPQNRRTPHPLRRPPRRRQQNEPQSPARIRAHATIPAAQGALALAAAVSSKQARPGGLPPGRACPVTRHRRARQRPPRSNGRAPAPAPAPRGHH